MFEATLRSAIQDAVVIEAPYSWRRLEEAGEDALPIHVKRSDQITLQAIERSECLSFKSTSTA
jgi:hypothetical protein